MKNATNDGVICDRCAKEVKTDFTYYSLDFSHYKLNGQVVGNGVVTLSVDFCQECIGLYSNYIVTNQGGRKCEITGASISADGFYQCKVSKVKVKINDEVYRCVKCGESVIIGSKACAKCSGSDFLRYADTIVDDAYLEFIVAPTTYERLATDLRRSIESRGYQWTL